MEDEDTWIELAAATRNVIVWLIGVADRELIRSATEEGAVSFSEQFQSAKRPQPRSASTTSGIAKS